MIRKMIAFVISICLITSFSSCTKTEYVTEYIYVNETPLPTISASSSPKPTETIAAFTYPELPPEIEAMLIWDFPDEYWDAQYIEPALNKPIAEIPKELIKPNSKMPFSPYDMEANGLKYGMTLDYALEILGTPEAAYLYWDEGIQSDFIALFYSNGDSYEFELMGWRYCLRRADICSNAQGPRGISVGSTVEDVLGAFRIDDSAMDERTYRNGMLLYSQNVLTDSDNIYKIAPSGAIFSEKADEQYFDNGLFILYDHPYDPFIVGYSDVQNYDFNIFHYCQFVTENGVVTRYKWGITVYSV